MEPQTTTKVNWPRVFGCGTLAGIVWIVLGSIVTALLGRDFAALPHNRLGAPTPGFLILNVVLDLLEGLSILWLYASIRPAYRPGPRTALIAAFAWWCGPARRFCLLRPHPNTLSPHKRASVRSF